MRQTQEILQSNFLFHWCETYNESYTMLSFEINTRYTMKGLSWFPRVNQTRLVYNQLVTTTTRTFLENHKKHPTNDVTSLQ